MMRDSKPTRIVSSVTLVGAVGFLFLFFHPFPPQPPASLHEAIGEVMAEQTLRLLGPDGRVLVISREFREFEKPAGAVQLGAFNRVLKKAGKEPSVTRLVKIDPDRLMVVPSGDFLELLRKTTEKDVVASFMGPPLLGPMANQKGADHAKVVAICTGSMPVMVDLHGLFGSGLLHAAITDRPGAVMSASKPPSGRSWFDQLYQVITEANLAELPGRSPDAR
jgi:hypothetical protein